MPVAGNVARVGLPLMPLVDEEFSADVPTIGKRILDPEQELCQEFTYLLGRKRRM
jgi:hypothetical protein